LKTIITALTPRVTKSYTKGFLKGVSLTAATGEAYTKLYHSFYDLKSVKISQTFSLGALISMEALTWKTPSDAKGGSPVVIAISRSRYKMNFRT
jgi:hypothetical protein